MNDRIGYSITDLLVSKWGKHVGIAPKTDGTFEIYNKKERIRLGIMRWEKRWKELVWEDQDPDVMMSKSCLDEAFELVEEKIDADSIHFHQSSGKTMCGINKSEDLDKITNKWEDVTCSKCKRKNFRTTL